MAPIPYILDPFFTMPAASCHVNFPITIPTCKTNSILDPPSPTFLIKFYYMEELCEDAYEVFENNKAKIKKSQEKFISRKSLKIDQKVWLFIVRLNFILEKFKSNNFKIFDPGGFKNILDK